MKSWNPLLNILLLECRWGFISINKLLHWHPISFECLLQLRDANQFSYWNVNKNMGQKQFPFALKERASFLTCQNNIFREIYGTSFRYFFQGDINMKENVFIPISSTYLWHRSSIKRRKKNHIKCTFIEMEYGRLEIIENKIIDLASF